MMAIMRTGKKKKYISPNFSPFSAIYFRLCECLLSALWRKVEIEEIFLNDRHLRTNLVRPTHKGESRNPVVRLGCVCHSDCTIASTEERSNATSFYLVIRCTRLRDEPSGFKRLGEGNRGDTLGRLYIYIYFFTLE